MSESRMADSLNSNYMVRILILVVLAVAVWAIRNILLLVFASVILVVLFTMPMRVLTRWGVRRSPALLISLVGLVALIFLLSLLVFPGLFQQFTILATEVIPEGVQALIDWWNSGELYEAIPFLEGVLQPIMEDLRITDELITTVVGQIGNALGQVSTSVLPLVGGVANTVLSIIIVIFLSLYFLAEPQVYEDGIISLFPLWYRHRIREIMERIDLSLRSWLKVTGASMLIVGVGTSIGLAIIGIQQWAALGVLAGVMSFIPNFGPIVALIPSISVGIIQAPQNVGWIIVIIYGVSFVQSQLISPLLVSETLHLPPVMVLLGQIVFGIFFGFMGIMLAVPITVITMVLVQEIYVRDILGDISETEDERILVKDEEPLPDGT